MGSLEKLENSLEGVFVKSAPKLPENGKKILVEWLPWINLILGIFALASVYWLWQWAHAVNKLIDYANSLSQAYGGTNVVDDRLTVGVWLALAVLAVEALLYILAFPGLRARKKSGWNLLFYAVLVNLIYGVVVLFTNYGSVGNLIGYLLGTVIGLYFLFQIRDKYNGRRTSASEQMPVS